MEPADRPPNRRRQRERPSEPGYYDDSRSRRRSPRRQQQQQAASEHARGQSLPHFTHSSTSKTLGNERINSFRRQTGGLVFVFGLCVALEPLTAVTDGLDDRNGVSSSTAMEWSVWIGALCQLCAGVWAVLVGGMAMILDASNLYCTLSLLLATHLGWIPVVSDLVRIGQHSAGPYRVGAREELRVVDDGTTTTSSVVVLEFVVNPFVPEEYDPTQRDVRFFGSMGLFGVAVYSAALFGALLLSSVMLLSVDTKPYPTPHKYNSRHYQIYLLVYTFLLVLAGMAQLLLGAYCLNAFDVQSPYEPSMRVAMFVVRYPELSVLVGGFQMLVGYYGIARYLAFAPTGRGNHEFQVLVGTSWILQIGLQYITQIGISERDQLKTQLASLTLLGVGIHLMPAFLDMKMRCTPTQISPKYYAIPTKAEIELLTQHTQQQRLLREHKRKQKRRIRELQQQYKDYDYDYSEHTRTPGRPPYDDTFVTSPGSEYSADDARTPNGRGRTPPPPLPNDADSVEEHEIYFDRLPIGTQERQQSSRSPLPRQSSRRAVPNNDDSGMADRDIYYDGTPLHNRDEDTRPVQEQSQTPAQANYYKNFVNPSTTVRPKRQKQQQLGRAPSLRPPSRQQRPSPQRQQDTPAQRDIVVRRPASMDYDTARRRGPPSATQTADTPPMHNLSGYDRHEDSNRSGYGSGVDNDIARRYADNAVDDDTEEGLTYVARVPPAPRTERQEQSFASPILRGAGNFYHPQENEADHPLISPLTASTSTRQYRPKPILKPTQSDGEGGGGGGGDDDDGSESQSYNDESDLDDDDDVRPDPSEHRLNVGEEIHYQGTVPNSSRSLDTRNDDYREAPVHLPGKRDYGRVATPVFNNLIRPRRDDDDHTGARRQRDPSPDVARSESDSSQSHPPSPKDPVATVVFDRVPSARRFRLDEQIQYESARTVPTSNRSLDLLKSGSQRGDTDSEYDSRDGWVKYEVETDADDDEFANEAYDDDPEKPTSYRSFDTVSTLGVDPTFAGTSPRGSESKVEVTMPTSFRSYDSTELIPDSPKRPNSATVRRNNRQDSRKRDASFIKGFNTDTIAEGVESDDELQDQPIPPPAPQQNVASQSRRMVSSSPRSPPKGYNFVDEATLSSLDDSQQIDPKELPAMDPGADVTSYDNLFSSDASTGVSASSFHSGSFFTDATPSRPPSSTVDSSPAAVRQNEGATGTTRGGRNVPMDEGLEDSQSNGTMELEERLDDLEQALVNKSYMGNAPPF